MSGCEYWNAYNRQLSTTDSECEYDNPQPRPSLEMRLLNRGYTVKQVVEIRSKFRQALIPLIEFQSDNQVINKK
jgi:hypothetical protein